MSDSNTINQFNFNPKFKGKKKKPFDVEYFVEEIFKGNKLLLSEAITIIESDNEFDRELAQEILFKINHTTDKSTRIAITGSPGVGKSTFINSYGFHLINKGEKLAVLAVDPSSQSQKGSILGDKTRMENLVANKHAFVRPSSSGNLLGGINKGTKDSISLCEAAGFTTIMIETVGVGQSEFWASMVTDMTILLLQPGAGDDLQGIKRGILEMADLLIVNKADGDQKSLAENAKVQYKNVVNLFQPKIPKYTPSTVAISSLEHSNFEDVDDAINDFMTLSKKTNFYNTNRIDQDMFWYKTILREEIFKIINADPRLGSKLKEI
jgi:LAO/AO transport system kinase